MGVGYAPIIRVCPSLRRSIGCIGMLVNPFHRADVFRLASPASGRSSGSPTRTGSVTEAKFRDFTGAQCILQISGNVMFSAAGRHGEPKHATREGAHTHGAPSG
jgi:hypothetical protein